MTPILLDGKKLSEKIRNEIRREIEERKTKNLRIPKLATILVGNNPASETYVSMKIKACHGVGMGSEMIRLEEQTTTEELLSVIDKLNADPNIDGILLQHPSPLKSTKEQRLTGFLFAKTWTESPLFLSENFLWEWKPIFLVLPTVWFFY